MGKPPPPQLDPNLAAFSDKDLRRELGARQRGANALLKAAAPPYDGGELAPLMPKIREMHAAGNSLAEIMATLWKDGYTPPTDRVRSVMRKFGLTPQKRSKWSGEWWLR